MEGVYTHHPAANTQLDPRILSFYKPPAIPKIKTKKKYMPTAMTGEPTITSPRPAAKPVSKTNQPKLTDAQRQEFRVVTNRVSLESLRFATDVCGLTPLLTETITALEKIVEGSQLFDSVHCRQLYDKARKADPREELLLDAITTALKWANSDGSGQFMVGNLIDPIYAARSKRNEPHTDEEIYQRLDEIRTKCLSPYYEQLRTKNTSKKG